MTIDRDVLVGYCNHLLKVNQFQDYCPNGLQVEGASHIKKIVTGVTACEALIDEAIALNADALLVHHGYFWKGEEPALVGMRGRRIKKLMQNNINLLAYHLPLDAHPEYGNNAQLAQRLGLIYQKGLDTSENPVGSVGVLDKKETLSALADRVAVSLSRQPLVVGDKDRQIERVAWCTGGAQSFIGLAAEAGCDCYITGEVSEKTVHEAREMDIAFIAAGHHATERYGALALGEHLQKQFRLDVTFVDIDNPA